MEKQKKNSASGITLIALVISIIVMLILAGVSINALVGDNGVLTQTQYASFLNEMSAVEEAVQLWKTGKVIEANGAETTAIPTNGMCNVAKLQSTERLVGEVGFYRLWSIGGTMPTKAAIDTINPNDFNSAYDGELVFYPAGVQDLYYLNNDALDIKGNKEYLIDASTGLIYSMKGIALKGIRCYSSNMAKAIMNGDITAPLFAEAEVSGSGSGEKLAGNVSTEYLDSDGKPLYKVGDKYYYEDGTEYTGTVTTNEDYNENGFKIIASPGSNNVFKLYNNGDLYGKGLKGIQLNTSTTEMDAISPYVWKEFSVGSEVGAYKNIYPTEAGIFVIDNNDDVWSLGNSYGLTDDQRVEYTGREWVKLDLGKNGTGTAYKAKKVFGTTCCVYIVTTTNELLGTGTNQYGQLGCNDKTEKTTFVKISNIPDPSSIQNIFGSNYNGEGGSTIIKCTDASDNNHFYLSGTDVWGGLGFGIPHNISSTTFIEIFNGASGRGDNIANDLNNIFTGHHENCILWFKNGDIYWTGWGVNFLNGKWAVPPVVDIRYSPYIMVLKCNNAGTIEYYAGCGRNNYALGQDYFHTSAVAVRKIDIPDGITIQDFDIYNGSAAYFLTTTGDIYGMGVKGVFGDKDNYTGWTYSIMEKLTAISEVDSFFSNKFDVFRQEHGTTFICKGGKLYLTRDTNLMYGNDILQKTWTLVAQNVLDFDPRNTAYITRDHNIYIAGSDSRTLGLGTVSESEVSVDNYTPITQTGIAGKARQVCQVDNATYIVTTDNKLYAAGRSEPRNGEYPLHGWETKDASGNWVYENKTTYVELKSNVAQFIPSYGYYQSKAYLGTDGKLYAMGHYTPYIGQENANITQFVEITFPTAIGSVDNIKKWLPRGDWRSYLLHTNGKVYYAGTWTAVYGGGQSKRGHGFEEFTYGMTLNSGETIRDIASTGQNSCMMLTTEGRIFGFGNACYIGIDRTDSGLEGNQLIDRGEISGKKLTQIAGGANWYLAVDEDGRVYGTGNNVYGVLGRWKGTGRATPNSRYRSAYVWVECPELEI